MTRYDIVGYLWIFWAILQIACYLWLEFICLDRIVLRLSKRLKDGFLVKLNPELDAIKQVSSDSEFQDYVCQRKYYRFWYIYIFILPTIFLLIVTSVVW